MGNPDDDSVSADLDDDQISICSGGVFSETASVVSQLSNASASNEANLPMSKIDLSQVGNKKRRSALYQKLRSEQKKVACYSLESGTTSFL